MIADVSSPDLETRMAILKAKLAEKSFYLEEDVVKFIAENIKNNIRELEGSLNRIMAACEFGQKAPDMELVKRTLSDLISSGKKKGVQQNHRITSYNVCYTKLLRFPDKTNHVFF